ncbi:MAG: DUF72 domain-containing protein [Acidobacteria bacterium]|nr:DUF72 domain-containing protein [Acidobacteriota bacterium]
MSTILAGTSGYSYKPWKGPFYPEDLSDARMLEYYAGQLPAVEINNTFYRMPTAKLIDKWLEVTPPAFRMVLKASRRLTHRKKLEPPEDALTYMLDVTSNLGDRLGCHLFQLPPYASIDLDGLRTFLASVPDEHRVALEFRHASWFVDETFEALAARDAALVVADGGKVEVPREVTASWGYLRLRRDDYESADVAEWASWIAEQKWGDCFVFFKHEDAGVSPRLAREMIEAVNG